MAEDRARDPMVDADDRRQLLFGVLEDSRSAGFLGPGPIEVHVEHAKVFLADGELTGDVLDLGSGGGLPGLVLALEQPSTAVTLLDAMERRCRFLRTAVRRLGLDGRVDVVCGRAEELAHSPDLRGRFDTVVARSFGAPAVTVECAVGFLRGPGARLLVSEPPTADGRRWPAEGLALLNLGLGRRLVGSGGTVQVLELRGEVPQQYPRRVGVPSKRPLFG